MTKKYIETSKLPQEIKELAIVGFCMGFNLMQGDNALVYALARQTTWSEMHDSAKEALSKRDDAVTHEFVTQLYRHFHDAMVSADSYTQRVCHSAYLEGEKKYKSEVIKNSPTVSNTVDNLADIIEKGDKDDGK